MSLSIRNTMSLLLEMQFFEKRLEKGTLIVFMSCCNKVIKYQLSLCMQHPRIACNPNHVLHAAGRPESLIHKMWGEGLKFLEPAAILILTKYCPTISGQFNLVLLYLKKILPHFPNEELWYSCTRTVRYTVWFSISLQRVYRFIFSFFFAVVWSQKITIHLPSL